MRRALYRAFAACGLRYRHRLAALDRFWAKEQTRDDVEVFILDRVHVSLPSPPFSAEEKQQVAASGYAHVWQQAVQGYFGARA